ncbi:MAG: hypothetical protein SA339_09945 [Methanomassiliicoccus sp.]|nr:hypothetical protein [Methanomassiliicoccus sp.]
MTILVSINGGSIDRIVKETYRQDVIPEIDGRLGKYDSMHMCFTARLISPPDIEVRRPGSISVRVPIEGKMAIPWGVGVKYHMEASTDIGVAVEGRKVATDVSRLTVQNLRLGGGCPMPKGTLELIGSFVQNVFLRLLMGPSGGPLVDLPSIQLPLSELLPDELTVDAPPIEIEVKSIVIEPPGIVLNVGMKGDETPPAPLPAQEGWDVLMAVSDATAEVMMEKAMAAIGDIKGNMSFAIPDASEMADVLVASAEMVTTLGRLGLGRRKLRSGTFIRVEYSARSGRPKLCFQEGGRIAICQLPAHMTAKAFLEVERFKGSIWQRLRSFFRPYAEGREALYEKAVVNSWDFDEDFVIERAEVTVKQEPKMPPQMDVTALDLTLELPWPLPEKTMERVVEGLGKGIITSRLPKAFPTEIPLPPEMPFKLKLEDMQVSTSEGLVIIRSNIGLMPEGDAEHVKQVFRERLKTISPMLTKSPGTS